MLAEKAWQRVKSSDASVSEKAAALAVAAGMKAKTAVGGGKRRRGRRVKNKRGGNIKRKRRGGNKKKSRSLQSLWSMVRSGRGLYLKPYQRVY